MKTVMYRDALMPLPLERGKKSGKRRACSLVIRRKLEKIMPISKEGLQRLSILLDPTALALEHDHGVFSSGTISQAAAGPSFEILAWRVH